MMNALNSVIYLPEARIAFQATYFIYFLSLLFLLGAFAVFSKRVFASWLSLPFAAALLFEALYIASQIYFEQAYLVMTWGRLGYFFCQIVICVSASLICLKLALATRPKGKGV